MMKLGPHPLAAITDTRTVRRDNGKVLGYYTIRPGVKPILSLVSPVSHAELAQARKMIAEEMQCDVDVMAAPTVRPLPPGYQVKREDDD